MRCKNKLKFLKEPKDLKIEESAMLVGMLQNSSYYDPFRRPEITRNRRNLVFNQMEKNKFISTKVKDSLKQLPLELEYNPQSHRKN